MENSIFYILAFGFGAGLSYGVKKIQTEWRKSENGDRRNHGGKCSCHDVIEEKLKTGDRQFADIKADITYIRKDINDIKNHFMK